VINRAKPLIANGIRLSITGDPAVGYGRGAALRRVEPIMTESASPSLLEVLRSAHRSIGEALVDPQLTSAGEHGATLREQLVAELVRHFVSEEQYLFPTLRKRLPDGDALADRGFDRGRAMEAQLRQLEDTDDLARIAEILDEVRVSFAAHVQQQEAEFGRIAEACTDAELAELGEGVLGAEQLAPTRPRSVAVEAPALNKVVSLISGFVDQVRDHYSGRGVEGDR
jgi:hypothetical protein